MVKYFYKSIKDNKLEALDSFRVGSWIYVESPNEEELSALAKDFNLDKGHLTDATDIHEVPRVESEDGAIYIFSRFPYGGAQKEMATAPLMIAIGEDFLITVSPKPFPQLEKFMDGRVDFYTTQKTKLFLQLFAQINSSYNRSVNDISRKIRSLSVRLEKINNRDIVQFVAFEEVLNDFLSSLVPMSSMLQNLLSGRSLRLYEEDIELAEDLLLHNGQLIELSRSGLKTIVNIRNAYSTILTNNLNRVIRLLTALTIILTVPVIVSGFYGMNVALPFADSPFAFAGIVIFVTAVVGLLLSLFAKNKWL